MSGYEGGEPAQLTDLRELEAAAVSRLEPQTASLHKGFTIWTPERYFLDLAISWDENEPEFFCRTHMSVGMETEEEGRYLLFIAGYDESTSLMEGSDCSDCLEEVMPVTDALISVTDSDLVVRLMRYVQRWAINQSVGYRKEDPDILDGDSVTRTLSVATAIYDEVSSSKIAPLIEKKWQGTSPGNEQLIDLESNRYGIGAGTTSSSLLFPRLIVRIIDRERGKLLRYQRKQLGQTVLERYEQDPEDETLFDLQTVDSVPKKDDIAFMLAKLKEAQEDDRQEDCDHNEE